MRPDKVPAHNAMEVTLIVVHKFNNKGHFTGFCFFSFHKAYRFQIPAGGSTGDRRAVRIIPVFNFVFDYFSITGIPNSVKGGLIME